MTSNESIRYWTDGSTPTASEGHEICAGEIYKLSVSQGLNAALLIAETDAAVMEVSCRNFQSI